MAKRRQVIGVLGFRAARVQGKVAFGGGERGRVVARLVGRVGRHHHRFAGPLRIGVLALDFLEQQDGILIVAGIEFRGGLVVELFHGALDIGEFRVAPCGLAGAKHQRAGSNRQGEGCQSGHGGRPVSATLCGLPCLLSANAPAFPRPERQGLRGRMRPNYPNTKIVLARCHNRPTCILLMSASDSQEPGHAFPDPGKWTRRVNS